MGDAKEYSPSGLRRVTEKDLRKAFEIIVSENTGHLEAYGLGAHGITCWLRLTSWLT